MGQSATVTDSTGESIEIEDELLTVYTLTTDSDEFDK